MRRVGSSGRCALRGIYPTLHTLADIHTSAAWMKISVQPNGCWHWMGIRLKHTDRTMDYGVINVGRKVMKAHVLVKMFFDGRTRRGKLQYLHTCDVPYCVNPDHVFRGTNQENHADKVRKGRHWQQRKTACPQGHPYDAANTYNPPGAPTARQCRTCRGFPLLTFEGLDKLVLPALKLPSVSRTADRGSTVRAA